jgi:hypothetical protein
MKLLMRDLTKSTVMIKRGNIKIYVRVYGQMAFIVVYMIPLVLITVSGASKMPGYMKA